MCHAHQGTSRPPFRKHYFIQRQLVPLQRSELRPVRFPVEPDHVDSPLLVYHLKIVSINKVGNIYGTRYRVVSNDCPYVSSLWGRVRGLLTTRPDHESITPSITR